MLDKQICQHLKDIDRLHLAGDHNRQAFPRVFIDHGQHLQWSTVMCPIRDEVVGPDMIAMLGTTSDAGPVVEPEATPFRLLLRHFQSLPTPQAFDSLVVYTPAQPAQKSRDAAVPVPAVTRRQLDHLLDQTILVLRRQWTVTLR